MSKVYTSDPYKTLLKTCSWKYFLGNENSASKEPVIPGHSPPSQSSPDSKSSTPSWQTVPSQAGEELSQVLALAILQSPPQPREDQAPHPPWTRS